MYKMSAGQDIIFSQQQENTICQVPSNVTETFGLFISSTLIVLVYFPLVHEDMSNPLSNSTLNPNN